MNDLSIIIPAYKPDFLSETLESFANQINKDFVIYIGDDASPHDIFSIVKKFETKLNIKYIRFIENKGGDSLTDQWERCIDMSNEEWIWLFSDDDIVKEDAVQIFYDTVNKSKSLLYKFHTKVINSEGKFDKYFQKFDNLNFQFKVLSSQEFILNRLKCNGFRSYAVEYIFHRSLYEKNKFVKFPLAWASDDATWFLYSLKNKENIQILPSIVYWRYSGVNISADHTNIKTINSKIDASTKYIKWLRNNETKYSYHILNKHLKKWLLIQFISLNHKFKFNEIRELLSRTGLEDNIFTVVKYYVNLKMFYIYKRIRKCIK